MKGEILIIDEDHRKAARQIVAILLADLQPTRPKIIITVAGDSGAGKSEIAAAVADELDKRNFNCFIFQQDDLKGYPPEKNAGEKAKNISNVFIDRDINDSWEFRKKNNGKRTDNHPEKILTIVHENISKPKGLTDILITKEFDAVKV